MSRDTIKELKPKVGLITTIAPGDHWPEEIVNKAKLTHNKVKDKLISLGFDVYEYQDLIRDYSEMRKAGKELRYKGIEVLVIYVYTWTYSSNSIAAALETEVPVVIWADATLGNAGITGGAVVKGGMDEVGIYSNLIYGAIDDPETLNELRIYCIAGSTASRLKGQVLGVFGGRCMGMVTAEVDPNQWKINFGIDIDEFEQLEVIERAKNIPEDEATKFLVWMRNTFGKIEAKDEVMLAQIKLYLALKNIIAEKKYDFIAVKCLPELPSIYTTFCLAHAFLNSKFDFYGSKEPFVMACEADLNGALTMQILKHISHQAVMFTDITYYNCNENLLTLCNCGSHPIDHAPTLKDIWWLKEGIREFKWLIGGTCPQFVAKEGIVTMSRLSRIKGKYAMLIVTGEAISQPRERLKETVWERPHAFIRPNSTPQKFIKSIRSNHIHIVYGDYSQELEEVCKILGIEPIVV